MEDEAGHVMEDEAGHVVGDDAGAGKGEELDAAPRRTGAVMANALTQDHRSSAWASQQHSPDGYARQALCKWSQNNIVICRECFSIMLKEGKVECIDGKWRHKLTKGIGDVCRFVHAYISCDFANETMNAVLNAHAKSTRRVSTKKKTKSKAKLSKAEATRVLK